MLHLPSLPIDVKTGGKANINIRYVYIIFIFKELKSINIKTCQVSFQRTPILNR